MNKATDIVTDSSNVTSTSLPSFEGLREAVFAAVNSHNLSPTLTANSHSEVEVDSKKENIRASNRERKKKWRVHNEERNKDNDLRCRVNKRASKLYGEADSLEKETWAKEEFQRRRAKRMEKEQRKHIVNNVLSIPQSPVFDSMDTKLEFPPELQRQLLEQLNQSMLAITHGIKNYSTNNMEIESEDSIEKKPEYPMDAVLSLMQLNAWTGERLGSAKVTLQTEDFQRLEVETDRKRLAFEKVHAAANIMQSQLGKRKPSPEDNFKTKRQPNDILGVCWINYGNEFTDDAVLGNSLVGFGQAQSRLGDYQEDFSNAMKTEYLDKLEEGMNQFKEYQALRKKLESRRLDYDAKLTRLQKSKKEKPELEQEMQAAKIKYEESEYDLIQKLAQLQEFEDEHCEALYQLLELQTQHLTRSLEMVQQVKANWGRGTPSVVNARQTKLTSVSRPELGIARQSSTDFSLSPRSSPNIRKLSFQEEPSHLSPRLSPNVRKASIHEEPSHLSPRLSPAARSEDTRPPLLPRKTSQSALPKRKALYDFVASSPDELDFKTNNVIQVVEQLDEGWWLGELEGRRGIFPVNYTEVIQGPPLPTRPTLVEESPFESPASPLPRRIPPPPPASRTPPVSAFQSKTDYFGACVECGCNEFTANVFKKGHCNNCFHKH